MIFSSSSLYYNVFSVPILNFVNCACILEAVLDDWTECSVHPCMTAWQRLNKCTHLECILPSLLPSTWDDTRMGCFNGSAKEYMLEPVTMTSIQSCFISLDQRFRFQLLSYSLNLASRRDNVTCSGIYIGDLGSLHTMQTISTSIWISILMCTCAEALGN